MSQQGRIKSPKQLRMRPSQNQRGGFANRQQTGQQQQDTGAHPAYGKQLRDPGTTQPIEAQTRRATKGHPPQR